MRLKPSCSWCKEYDKFAENKELRIVLACYKKLCEYVAATPIAQNIGSSSNNGGPNTTLDILQEGMAITDSYDGNELASESSVLQFLMPSLCSNLSRKDGSRRNVSVATTTNGISQGTNPEVGFSPTSSFQAIPGSVHSSESLTNGACFIRRKRRDSDRGGDRNVLSLRISRNKMKRKHRSVKHKKKKHKSSRRRKDEKRKHKSRRLHGEFSGDRHKESHHVDKMTVPPKRLVISGHRAKLVKEGKSIPEVPCCRCGTNGISSGTFPCISQRCPCFVVEKTCENCKCKGCHNPFTLKQQVAVNGEDEKLEQKESEKVDEVKKETNGSDSDSYIDVTGTANS